VTALSADFGYYPERLELEVGSLSIATRADLGESVRRVEGSPYTKDGWIYAPSDRRVFVLPKTHSIAHAAADGPEHLAFLVWVLSYFSGLRLTTTEAGFVDATPVKGHALVDFVRLNRVEYERGLVIAEEYWQAHRAEPRMAKRWSAAVHAMFLAQYPRAMTYERVIYHYAALDACYRLAAMQAGLAKDLGHPKRIPWMCDRFGMPVPNWATHVENVGSEVSTLRAGAIHEALFMGEPLGFALHDRKSAENLPLEMANLVSRFLAALLGLPGREYVRSPVSTYMAMGLDV